MSLEVTQRSVFDKSGRTVRHMSCEVDLTLLIARSTLTLSKSSYARGRNVSTPGFDDGSDH